MASKLTKFESLDYYVWGKLEQETNKSRHNTVNSLKQKDATAAIEVVHACSRFQKRIEEVLEAEGGWIE